MALRGEIAVVTGASRSIGRGVALQLGAAGAKVYVTGRKPRDGADSSLSTLTGVAQEISKRGGEGVVKYVDHKNQKQVKDFFSEVAEENNGALHILVNNVFSAFDALPSSTDKPFYEIEPEIWDEVGFALYTSY